MRGAPTEDLVASLRSQGIRLIAEDGQLVLRGPRRFLTQELVGQVRARKEEILAQLEGAPAPFQDLQHRWSLAIDRAVEGFQQHDRDVELSQVVAATKLILDMGDSMLPDGMTEADAERCLDQLFQGELRGRLLESGRVALLRRALAEERER